MVTHTGNFHEFLFPSLVWKMPGDGIYLTFDDGPHPKATPEVLNVLRSERIRGTFFLTGRNVADNESIVREIAAEGHTIGNHGFKHSRRPAFSSKQSREEILRTEEILQPLCQLNKKLFRPPYGFFSWHTISGARDLGYQIIMWSTLTGDFRHNDRQKIVGTALNRLDAGSILVFHDNEQTVGRIGPILSECILRIKESGHTLRSI